MDNSAVSCACVLANYTQKKVWGQTILKYVPLQIPNYMIWKTSSSILGLQCTSSGAPGACPWEGGEHPPERMGCCYVTRCFEIQSNKRG